MNDEIGNLTRFLEDHRAIFRRKAGGLNRDQLQQTLSPSDLTLGGMVKHLTFVEDWWFGRHLGDAQSEPWASVDWAADDDWDWHSAADDTPEELWAGVGGRRGPLPGRRGHRPPTRAGRASTAPAPPGSRSPCAGSSRTWSRSTHATTATPT